MDWIDGSTVFAGVVVVVLYDAPVAAEELVPADVSLLEIYEHDELKLGVSY